MDRKKLAEDNVNLVYHILHKYYPTWAYDEDVQQEGMTGLCEAANTFDESRNIKFSTYATVCILNNVRIYFRRNKKHNGIASLDYMVQGDENEMSIIDILVGDENINFDYLLFDQFYKTLNSSDKELVQLLSKHTQEEVAKVYGATQATISRRKSKLKKKWRKFNV